MTHKITVQADNRVYCTCPWTSRGNTGMDAALIGRSHLNRMRLKGEPVDLLVDVK